MTSSLIERLEAAQVLVADGATGTNYHLMGLEPESRPEEWLFDEPDKVKALHRRFIAAGADIILTNSFGGNPLRLKESPYSHAPAELNRRAAQLAREVAAEAERQILIGGSMGPTGQLLKPLGPVTTEEVSEGYAQQAAALAQGGVDFLIIETMFDLGEARAAVEGTRQATDLPLVCSFSFDRGTRTMMGISPRDVIEALGGAGLAAIGLNCGRSLEESRQALQEMVQALGDRLPLWCKPNAGLPKYEGGVTKYDLAPQQMGQWALEFLKLGARVIGGCCGTTPEHIAAIASTLTAYREG